MYIPEIELHQCGTLSEAATLMQQYAPHARLMAGGTDLLVDLKTGRTRTAHVISISRISRLHHLVYKGGSLHIGALTTISELERSRKVADFFPVLVDTARQMAAEQIRNIATVGGNIASAVPCADLPPVLMVLNSQATVWSAAGERSEPLNEFFVGPRQTILKAGEVLCEVVVPAPRPAFGAAYERFALRDGNAIAVAAVAASLQLNGDDTIQEARVALGSVSPVPKLVESLSTSLAGRMACGETFEQAAVLSRSEAQPISDVRGSADYRRELVGILTPRALRSAFQRAREAR